MEMILALVVTVLLLALVVCWIVLPGSSTVISASPEVEGAGSLGTVQQGV